MSVFETLATVVAALDALRIPHMLAGSLASSYHGEPRATQDIDLVVDPPSGAALERFGQSLPATRFYVPDVTSAFAEGELFNVIDTATGWKVDLIIRRDRAFSRSEFSRRQPAQIDDIEVYVATAEDTILAKLEWAQLGHSERQLTDVAAIVRTTGTSLDFDYLRRWADELDVRAALEAVLRSP